MVWNKVVGVKALDNAGGSISVKVGQDIIFITKKEQQFFGINAICSHAKCVLGKPDLEKEQVKCPCHNAVFDLKTGKMLEPPFVSKNAPMDKLGLNLFNVRENEGFIEVEI
ncbi:MAG: Rieske 2Fe-2S domain-containing protein [Cuniculiplasma sp.]